MRAVQSTGRCGGPRVSMNCGPSGPSGRGGCVGLWRSIGDTLHGSTVASVRACCNRV